MPTPFSISDGERIAEVDWLTNSLIVINSEHHEIHEGTNFRASVRASVGSGNTLSLTITTPAYPKQCHLILHVFSGNSCNVAFYESVAVTANTGNVVVARNSNRNHLDNSSAVVKSQATLNTTNATTLDTSIVGQAGGNPSNPDVGGNLEIRAEWVLKPDTAYSLVLTETGSVTQNMYIGFDWYEHEVSVAS